MCLFTANKSFQINFIQFLTSNKQTIKSTIVSNRIFNQHFHLNIVNIIDIYSKILFDNHYFDIDKWNDNNNDKWNIKKTVLMNSILEWKQRMTTIDVDINIDIDVKFFLIIIVNEYDYHHHHHDSKIFVSFSNGHNNNKYDHYQQQYQYDDDDSLIENIIKTNIFLSKLCLILSIIIIIIFITYLMICHIILLFIYSYYLYYHLDNDFSYCDDVVGKELRYYRQDYQESNVNIIIYKYYCHRQYIRLLMHYYHIYRLLLSIFSLSFIINCFVKSNKRIKFFFIWNSKSLSINVIIIIKQLHHHHYYQSILTKIIYHYLSIFGKNHSNFYVFYHYDSTRDDVNNNKNIFNSYLLQNYCKFIIGTYVAIILSADHIYQSSQQQQQRYDSHGRCRYRQQNRFIDSSMPTYNRYASIFLYDCVESNYTCIHFKYSILFSSSSSSSSLLMLLQIENILLIMLMQLLCNWQHVICRSQTSSLLITTDTKLINVDQNNKSDVFYLFYNNNVKEFYHFLNIIIIIIITTTAILFFLFTIIFSPLLLLLLLLSSSSSLLLCLLLLIFMFLIDIRIAQIRSDFVHFNSDDDYDDDVKIIFIDDNGHTYIGKLYFYSLIRTTNLINNNNNDNTNNILTRKEMCLLCYYNFVNFINYDDDNNEFNKCLNQKHNFHQELKKISLPSSSSSLWSKGQNNNDENQNQLQKPLRFYSQQQQQQQIVLRPLVPNYFSIPIIINIINIIFIINLIYSIYLRFQFLYQYPNYKTSLLLRKYRSNNKQKSSSKWTTIYTNNNNNNDCIIIIMTIMLIIISYQMPMIRCQHAKQVRNIFNNNNNNNNKKSLKH